MAFADPAQTTSEDDLKTIRRQIGQFLFNTPGQENVKTIGLRESFAVWQLDPEHFASMPPAVPAETKGYRHYQVYLDGAPRAHAIVQEIDGEHTINDVVVSTLAKEIDQAIDWIDEQHKDQTPVHYLVANSCRVHAFRLVQNDVIYVIAAPSTPGRPPEERQLSPGTILSTVEFLNRLKHLHETIQRKRPKCKKVESANSKVPQESPMLPIEALANMGE